MARLPENAGGLALTLLLLHCSPSPNAFNPVHARLQDNAKNYQLWNHRRKCALRAGPSSAEAELDFSMLALEIDEKNYHAWAHRLAIVQVSIDYSEWQRH